MAGLLATTSCLASSQQDHSSVVKIGVLAHRGGGVVLNTWSPLASYLNNHIEGYRFRIIPLELSETHEQVENGSIDFILTNPSNYIDLQKHYRLQALMTLRKHYRGQEMNLYGAVIFTRADNQSINTVEDLKVGAFMGVKPGSLGGFQMVWDELKKNNIDPFNEIPSLQFSGFPQSSVVYAVKNGLVDAGTVRTGILESMANDGLIALQDFKVINRKQVADFPYLLSTGLYPEWPLARLKNTDTKLASALYDALLAMPGDIIHSGQTLIGWGPAGDYTPVQELMQRLQVGPYKNAVPLTAAAFMKKYMEWVLIIAILVAVLAAFMLRTLILNRSLLLTKTDLEQKIQEGLSLKESLQSERNFLRALLDNITDGVLSCDRAGMITLYNQAMLSLCGLEGQDIRGAHWSDHVALYEDEHGKPLGADRNPIALIETGKAIRDSELLLKLGDQFRHVLISGQPHSNDAGERAGIVLSFADVTDRVAKDQRLRDSEKELRAILDSMQDTYYRTDLSGQVIRVSPSVQQMLGYRQEEGVGVFLPDLYVEPNGREKFLQTLADNDGKIQNYQMPMWHKDGHIIWVSTSAHFHYDQDGNVDGVEGVTRDITELKNAEAQLFREKERATITLQSIGDGVITMDVDGRIEYLNPYAEQMLGCSADTAINRPLSALLAFSDASSKIPLEDPVSMCLRGGQVYVYSEHVHATRNDGTRFAVKLTVSPMRDPQGSVQGVVMVMHDVSEMWKMAQQLSYQATHDALTGLINRREFDHQLNLALERCANSDIQHTLCYMDLDQFKIVNDTCGHVAGDRLLKQLAQVLVSNVRENDIFARLGGDEFGLLLEGCSLEKAEPIVEKIRRTVKEFRFSWEDKSFELGVSIGMVPVEGGTVSVAELLSEADAACYVAKDLGRNRIHKYELGDSDLVKHRNEMQWVNRIQQALEEGRFVCYCQSIQPLQCEDHVYAEILIRMLDENGDLVMPGAFIPAAERYHLMSKIDRWVIRDVFSWLQQTGGDADRYYTINLSGQSVGDDKILQYIIDCMREYNVDASAICFEITETAAVANLDSARVFIEQLHELGCKFALDDFGSGLSSFAYLKNLDVDFLKIDGSFVQDIESDPVDYAMVASINRIGHLMGIRTIAEFVENKEVLGRLKEIGVDYVQGYHIEIPHALSDMNDGKIARV